MFGWKIYIFQLDPKVIFSNGGKPRDIEHQLCSIVLETFTLMHINGFLLLNFINLALFCVEEGYTSPFFAVAIFGTKSLKTFESSFSLRTNFFLNGQIEMLSEKDGTFLSALFY